MAERHTPRVRTIPKDTLDKRDDGGGNSKSSSVSEETADPKSHTPVKRSVYRTGVSPAISSKTMVDPKLRDLTEPKACDRAFGKRDRIVHRRESPCHQQRGHQAQQGPHCRISRMRH